MNASAKEIDRRHFLRVTLPCHLRYLKIPEGGAEYANATVQEISKGGFGFRTNESFPRGSCFLLDLYLPGAKPIHSLATAAWMKALPEGDGYQIGGAFVEPNPEVQSALARIVPEQ